MRFFCFYLILTLPSIGYAGAWLQPTGQGMWLTQAGYFTGDAFFDQSGQLQPQDRFSKYELNGYGEYGFSKRLTVGANLFANRVSQSGKTNLAIADSEFFVRTPLWHNDAWKLSLQPLIKLPSLSQRDGPPRGGSRSLDGEISLLFGMNQRIFSDADFIDSRVGYRVRSRGLSAQYRLDTVYGIYLTPELLIAPAIRGIISAKPSENAAFSENAEQDFDLLKLEITTRYEFTEDRYVYGTLARHIQGVQSGAGQSIMLGYGANF